jgi:D-glycero-alpha-D-manno-heptose-7-phosphate kinase
MDEGARSLKLNLWNADVDDYFHVYAHKTPLRISLIGGGTDMPEFVEEAGWGMCASLSIDRGVAAVVQFGEGELEIDPRVDTPLTQLVLEDRASQRLIKKISMLEDLDTIGTGLGSSSAWVHSLSAAVGFPITEPLASYRIERASGSRCGYQDHAAASFRRSGLFTFKNTSYGVQFQSTELPKSEWLANRVSLFRIEGRRDSTTLLTKQAESIKNGDKVNSLLMVREMTELFVTAALRLDTDRCSGLLRDAWEIKKGYAPGVTNERIDFAVEAAISAGAGSAKILGAGSAGYLMVFRDPSRAFAVDGVLSELGMPRVKFELFGRRYRE